MKIDGLIFDFGFTLFEFKEPSVEKYFECYRKGLKKAIEKLKDNHILDNEEHINQFYKLFNKNKSQFFKLSLKTKKEYSTPFIFELVLESLNLEKLEKKFYYELANDYHFYEEREWVPYKITRKALKNLSNLKHLKMAVLSNHPHHHTIISLLKKHDLMEFFDTVVTSAEFGKRKPDPEIFLYTLKKMGLKNPKKCLICGDEHADIVGGYKAGLQTILCERIFKFPFERDIPILNHIKIKNISEIIKYIE